MRWQQIEDKFRGTLMKTRLIRKVSSVQCFNTVLKALLELGNNYMNMLARTE